MASTSANVAAAIEFWYSPGSCSVAGHVLLHESNLRFVSHTVPRGYEPNSLPASYTSVNPRKLIPALSVDGEIITELPAILVTVAYLSHHPEWVEGSSSAGLIAGRAKVYEWLGFLSSHVHATAFAAFFRPYRFTDREDVRPVVKQKGRQTIFDALADIEARLPAQPGFVVAGAFSVVDPFVYLIARWAELVETGALHRFPRLQVFARMMEQREATTKALESEGIPPLFQQ
ncbi:uncharacterized protein PFL1_04838 [Pseudozyma flocculosa PF-1]|uniref:Glutathione S-transferase n=2 Tax=Pseudozyma flocculosa TaxID=84751 RepID=A0A5C3F3T4_9BASI|nr:uncharacterized protein PFL1_04838 [Pseudozyma flocculosa PF-1]EPQ27700.1 hypothetical protein PFL1_04838 [Pseudozyma flocculosa PF-1]SPO39163.1 uncharacterized protein PSFLO_04642 [Pseudozyma flocculosa]